MGQDFLGTEWVKPGTGSNLASLLQAIGEPTKAGDETRATDLRLTGRPIKEYDKERILNATVGSPGSFPAKTCEECGGLIPEECDGNCE
jgi:hypothetical protein